MISFKVEAWKDIKNEVSSLLQLHWEEIGQNKIKMKLNFDVEKFELLDSRGMIHIVAVRNDEKLIGYHASIIDTLLHYKHVLAAKGDAYWLAPEFRKGTIGIKLLKEVERTLRARGVQVIYDITKLYFDHGAIFERLGYKPIERVYSKWIGD